MLVSLHKTSDATARLHRSDATAHMPEVECRTLAGDAWTVILDDGSTVADLRSSVNYRSAVGQLFAEGRTLDDDETLPWPCEAFYCNLLEHPVSRSFLGMSFLSKFTILLRFWFPFGHHFGIIYALFSMSSSGIDFALIFN